MAEAHFLQQLQFHSQLRIPCQTVLISYAPIHSVFHEVANSISELQQIIRMHSLKSQCVILCSEHQKMELQHQIKLYLSSKASGLKKLDRQVQNEDQLLDDLQDSNGQVHQTLERKLRQIVERTEKKVRQSKIKVKMIKIDSQIKKIEELQSKSNMKKTIQISDPIMERKKLNFGKKQRKKQKGMQKRLEELRDKKEFLQKTTNGLENSAVAFLQQLLKEKSRSSESQDSILL